MDEKLLTIYLNDHMAGATGAVPRLERMVSSYTDLSVHPQLVDLAGQVREDAESLRVMVERLRVNRRRSVQVPARVGELVGRTKLNGRLRGRSPLTPLVEIEAVRVGVLGKLSLWQTLRTHAATLAVDPGHLEELQDRAQDQLQILQECHCALNRTAFGKPGC